MARGRWNGAKLAATVLCSYLAACADPSGTSTDAATDTELASESEPTGGETETDDSAPDTSPDPDLGGGETDTGEGTDTDEGEPCEEAMPCPDCECIDGAWECECDPMVAEAGFYTIEPVDYSLGLDDEAMDLSSSTARLFYSFHPADELGFDKPLFVIFNGGPSVSSGLLMGTNTGPMTIDPAVAGDDGVVANDASWSTIGNLLYVDPRVTGFSYNLMGDPSDTWARDAEFNIRNFNPYLDAADFVRLLLRFLADHPQLEQVPIVIVGESYGGIRAGILLNLLLYHESFADGSMRYVDTALVEEVQDHFGMRFPDQDISDPAVISEQFPAQVLIQPAIGGLAQQNAAGELFELEGSPMHLLADELQVDFETCADKGPPCDPFDNGLDFIEDQGRSIYDYSASDDWLQTLFDNLAAGLTRADLLAALLDVELAEIEGLEPAERGADALAPYRVSSTNYFPTDDEMGNLATTLGPLDAWDRYFMIWNYEALLEFVSNSAQSIDVDHYDSHHGRNFLRNLAFVDTFITNAGYDVIIYGPSIAPTLAAYDSWILGTEFQPDLPAESPRPGQIRVTYVDGALPGIEPDAVRWVRQPTYDVASHSVTLDQPTELRDDVADWLLDIGL